VNASRRIFWSSKSKEFKAETKELHTDLEAAMKVPQLIMSVIRNGEKTP
jgi:hypothetical protein